MQSPISPSHKRSSTPAPTLVEGREQGPAIHTGHSWLAWWHRLAAPPPSATLPQQQAYQQGQLTSTILFIELSLLLGVLLTVGLFYARWLLPNQLATLLLLVGVAWLNRRGHLVSARLLLVIGMELALAFVILMNPGGLSVLALALFELLVLGELLAVSLLPAWTVFVVAAANIVFTWAALLWMPRTGEVTALLHSPALIDLLARPVFVGGMVALITYLWVQSARTALQRAEQSNFVATQERAVAAAQASQLAATFEAMADGVAVYNQDGQVIQVNAALCRLFGRPSASSSPTLQEEWATLLPPLEAPGPPQPPEQRPLARLLRGEPLTAAQMLDVSVQTPEELERQLNVSGAPIHDQLGNTTGAVLVYRDVTVQRHLQQRTQQALEALLAMAEALVQAPDAEAAQEGATSPRASLVMAQLATLTSRVLGCRGVSISTLDLELRRSLPLVSLGLPPELEQRWWAGERYSARWLDSQPTLLARLQKGETLVLDASQPPLNTEPNPYQVSTFLAVPMRVGERLVGLLILDPMQRMYHYTPEEVELAGATAKLGALVIERERLLREREETRARILALVEANERMDSFLIIASHELKTPLTSLQLHFQAAERRLRQVLTRSTLLPPELVHLLQQQCAQYAQLHQSMTRLARLGEDLLDTARIQANRLELRRQAVDLAALVQAVVEEHRQLTPARLIQLSRAGAEPFSCLGDADRLGQVVTNFLSNALKYSGEEQPVEVGVQMEAHQTRVWVRDHGPGIPENEQPRLGERFYRVPGIDVQSGSGVGLGLGLYISQTIIAQHQGQMGVESVPGQGSTFWFTLPLASTETRETPYAYP